MKNVPLILISLVIGSLLCGNLFGSEEEVVQAVGTNGSVNWTSGIITAKGSGAPPPNAQNPAQGRILAKRAAISDARRNLLEALQGVRVASTSVVRKYMSENDVIRTKVHGIIRGSKVTDIRYMSDGSVEATVSISVKGDLLSLFVKPQDKQVLTSKKGSKDTSLKPDAIAEKPPVKPAAEVTEPSEPGVPRTEGIETEEPHRLQLPDYTGLVLDARALKLKPALIPRILESSGKELYQSDVVSPEDAAKNGLALYARDLTAAQTNARVANNPITLKAIAVSDKSPCDVVVSDKDAETLKALIKQKAFLKQCRVMIVID